MLLNTVPFLALILQPEVSCKQNEWLRPALMKSGWKTKTRNYDRVILCSFSSYLDLRMNLLPSHFKSLPSHFKSGNPKIGIWFPLAFHRGRKSQGWNPYQCTTTTNADLIPNDGYLWVSCSQTSMQEIPGPSLWSCQARNIMQNRQPI